MVVVPVPLCFTTPVPETKLVKVIGPVTLNWSVPVSTIDPRGIDPVVPLVPIWRVPLTLMVVRPV